MASTPVRRRTVTKARGADGERRRRNFDEARHAQVPLADLNLAHMPLRHPK
jgi:hypothetical protein